MKQSVKQILVRDFELDTVLGCGQCFRWEKDGPLWRGVAQGRHVSVSQECNILSFYDTTPQEAEGFWSDYFDLQTDYSAMKRLFSEHPVMAQACNFAPGIHILRQEPWETLCTFILSQNNNIPRIKGLVQRLCEQFGDVNESGPLAFPVPEKLARLSPEELTPVRAGFRAAYLIDAARKVVSGEVDLAAIAAMETNEARQALMKIKGVGPKVADCTLLFGFHRLDSFPQDVWIKRAVAALFPEGLPPEMLPLAGVAQQYIFHYARCHPELF